MCASDGGSLPEVTRGYADEFPARSLPSMVSALDDCARRAQSSSPEAAEAASKEFLAQAPSIEEFAGHLGQILSRALGIGSGG